MRDEIRHGMLYVLTNDSSRAVGEALRPMTLPGNLTYEGALRKRRGPNGQMGTGSSPYSGGLFLLVPLVSLLRDEKQRRAYAGYTPRDLLVSWLLYFCLQRNIFRRISANGTSENVDSNPNPTPGNQFLHKGNHTSSLLDF